MTRRTGHRKALGALRSPVVLQLAVLAAGLNQLALGSWMALFPHAFFEAIGPYGAPNDHYTRDGSTWALAFGLLCLAGVRRSRGGTPRSTSRIATASLRSVGPSLQSQGVVAGTVTRYFGEHDKQRFVETWCATRDIPLADVAAVGDSRSDLPLFDRAGRSVALNATPEARSAATHVVDAEDLREVLPLLTR